MTDLRVFLGILFYSLDSSRAAHILGVFPTPDYSHHLIYQPLMRALADRGHQVTVISPQPLKDTHANYEDVNLSFLYETWKKYFDAPHIGSTTVDGMTRIMTAIHTKVCEESLNSTQIQSFIRTNRKFDVAIMERDGYLCFDALVHLAGSPPIISLLSYQAPTWLLETVGSPHYPSFMTNIVLEYSDHMTFWERVVSVYACLKFKYYRSMVQPNLQRAIIRKHLGIDVPLEVTDWNNALFMYHGHWNLGYPKPLTPNVVELQGLHIQRTRKPLPKDLQMLLDAATEGVVYISFGTNVDTRAISENFVKTVTNVFSRLPQLILWKWHDESVAAHLENVKILNWFPQQDILAHENIQLFITQGGLQSLQEAMYHSVPVLGLSILKEQQLNLGKICREGAGLQMKISEVEEEKLFQAISTIIYNNSFRVQMNLMSSRFRDEPKASEDLAVWWVEYVLRHKGAPDLRNAIKDLHLTQYCFLDVVLICILSLSAMAVTLNMIIRRISRNKLVNSPGLIQ